LAHKEKDTEKLLIGADGELNCVLCHSTEAPQSLTMVDRGKQPPYPLEVDRPLSAANASDRRYMQPIRYDRHCAGCHGQDLKLPQTVGKIKIGRRDANVDTRLGGDILPHRELPLIRQLIAARLASVAGKSQFGANITRQQWLSENFRSFARLIEPRLSTELSGAFKDKTIELPEVSSDAATQPSSGIDSLLIDYYEAAVAFDVCGKCHSVDGDLPSPKSDAARRALRTGPTKLSDTPRRWFSASQFDHDAHRAVRCIDCHSQALKSQNTSDVLMPDMTTRTGTAGSSCVDCHNPDPAPNRAAPAGCATCHLYHDRTHDRPPDGPATQPAPRTVAAAK
jgi:c(7)-type cytochrome triheme protein